MPDIRNGGDRDDDPRPIAPECPDSSECCNSGCSPCIFDLYAEELNRYRAALQAWEDRQKAASPR